MGLNHDILDLGVGTRNVNNVFIGQNRDLFKEILSTLLAILELNHGAQFDSRLK